MGRRIDAVDAAALCVQARDKLQWTVGTRHLTDAERADLNTLFQRVGYHPFGPSPLVFEPIEMIVCADPLVVVRATGKRYASGIPFIKCIGTGECDSRFMVEMGLDLPDGYGAGTFFAAGEVIGWYLPATGEHSLPDTKLESATIPVPWGNLVLSRCGDFVRVTAEASNAGAPK